MEDMQMEGDNYFDGYNDLEIHKLMLMDTARNKAYKEAIFDNEVAISGKVVLDVGAGTGILSVFCAQVGAAKVYAVEASEIHKVAVDVVKENGFENVIQVINKRIEDVDVSEMEKVDIVVSEWMGFYLLHEGMLDSVIYARDNFLKPGGLIFPEFATIYTAPCSFPDLHTYWSDVEGVAMETFARKLRANSSAKPQTAQVDHENILTDPDVLLWIDLKEVTVDDLNNVRLRHVAVANRAGNYEAICLWFTCTFPCGIKEPIILSTGPDEPLTHWKQTVIVMPESVRVDESEPITYDINVRRASNDRRKYDIELTMLDPEEVEHPGYCVCHMTKCILKRAVMQQYEQNT